MHVCTRLSTANARRQTRGAGAARNCTPPQDPLAHEMTRGYAAPYIGSLVKIAVLMPMSCPALDSSGPPELPAAVPVHAVSQGLGFRAAGLLGRQIRLMACFCLQARRLEKLPILMRCRDLLYSQTDIPVIKYR